MKVFGQSIKVLGIECKTRCNSNTEYMAKMLSSRFRSRYIKMKWNDSMLTKAVPSSHELIQCLHHSVVCDIDCVLLLVGDRSAKPIQGVLIVHDDVIKSVHKRFLQLAHKHRLKWSYENTEMPSQLQNLLRSTINASISDLQNELE